jgi:hypothetical protein
VTSGFYTFTVSSTAWDFFLQFPPPGGGLGILPVRVYGIAAESRAYPDP